MSQGNYEGISIREAMERINAPNNGWFLPNIQRQYVWGSRDSSEGYICLLLDSLFRGYPIGGLVLWETDARVPFREFLEDYNVDSVAMIVAEERWGYHRRATFPVISPASIAGGHSRTYMWMLAVRLLMI